jgi:uncharacterized protein (DUF2235 family)
MPALVVALVALAFPACTHQSPVVPHPTPTSVKPMKKRIVLFFDGTRNVAKSGTNVARLYDKVVKAGKGADGMPQTAIYFKGVGTRTTDIFTGAAFGRGVSRNVRDGYETLRAHFKPGDEVWLFGFSRGAFTARSLAGFVAQYGVLPEESSLDVHQLYGDYREIQQSRPIYFLTDERAQPLSPFEKALVEESRVTRIKFTGVWDTVGTIGVPWGNIRRISASENRFFELDPRAVYDECYQALAVDEERPHYRPILWKSFVPGEKVDSPEWPPLPRFEQRWFVGAHSNVGGGYKDPSDLYKVSLKWMEDKAAASGLGIADRQVLKGDEHLASINDSFGDFFLYKVAPWINRQPRPILREPEPKVTKAGKPGWVYIRDEVVDPTVYDRLSKGGGDGKCYAPAGLPNRE